jgi:hypothetical protein
MQKTLPVPSLVQLGSELTVPARLFHVPHFVPLNSLTIRAEAPLRTAHATSPVETGAQDGLPMPVAVPVEMKLPHVAHESGASPRQIDKSSMRTNIDFINLLQIIFEQSRVTDRLAATRRRVKFRIVCLS